MIKSFLVSAALLIGLNGAHADTCAAQRDTLTQELLHYGSAWQAFTHGHSASRGDTLREFTGIDGMVHEYLTSLKAFQANGCEWFNPHVTIDTHIAETQALANKMDAAKANIEASKAP